MSAPALSSEHLYKAGARLARSAGRSRGLRQFALTWTVKNYLGKRAAAKVMEGFDEEYARILMAGSATARSGRPYGRI